MIKGTRARYVGISQAIKYDAPIKENLISLMTDIAKGYGRISVP